MGLPPGLLANLEAIFIRAGKQLKNVDLIGDEIAKQIINIPAKGTYFLVGYAVSHHNTQNKIVADSAGNKYLVDNNNVLHAIS